MILEVDLEYPKELHELHKDYPLAPEPYQIINTQVKLCQTLHDKHHYVVHYKNLKYYLSKRLKLTKIHRAIAFTEEAFLKSYIE